MTVRMSTICAHCDHEHDFASVVASKPDTVPHDGDVSLCFRCGEWNVFEDRASGGLRKPTAREQKQMAKDQRCVKVRAAWLKVMLDRPKNISTKLSPSLAGTSFITLRH